MERRNRGPKRRRLTERRSSLNVEPTATSDVSVRRCQTAAPCREADSETNLFKNIFRLKRVSLVHTMGAKGEENYSTFVWDEFSN
jgi:hypothetical protein